MNNNEKSAQESGKSVWQALTSQLFEFKGFVMAAATSVLKVLAARWVLISVAVVFCAAVGAYRGYVQETVFESEAIATYSLGTKKVYGDMVVKFNGLVQERAIDQVASLLNVDPQVAATIVSVRATNILGDPLEEDVTADKSAFRIILQVNEVTYLDTLETALVYYLDSPEYVQERLLYNDIHGKRHIKELVAEIDRLEKDRSLVLASGASQESLAALAETMASLRAELKEERIHVLFNHNVELMDGFILAHRVKHTDPIGKALIYGFTAFLIAFMIALFLHKPAADK